MGWLVFQRLLYDACMYSLAGSACKRGHSKLVWRVCTIRIESIEVLGQRCPAYCRIAMMYSTLCIGNTMGKGVTMG